MVPFHLVVVNNASKDKSIIIYLEDLKRLKNVSVVNCSLNLWVLGFNKAIKQYLPDNADYFVVSDSDIIVPPVINSKCWLQKLIDELESNVVIGKLGISLDLGYIKSRSSFKETYEREVGYCVNKKIGSNVIAPVDTTLALYRTNYFMMEKPRFYPGHGVLGRPEYYTCRTNYKICAKHIGWRNYNNTSEFERYNISKLYCFTFVGAFLDPTFLNKIPIYYSLFYRFFRPVSRFFWALNVVAIQTLWFLKHCPFSLNKTQFISKR